MAVYHMANIWRDPRTGMCYFRRGVPAELRRLLGWELKVSLLTKDPKLAKQRYSVVASQADQRIREARQEIAERQQQATQDEMNDAYETALSEHRSPSALPAGCWAATSAESGVLSVCNGPSFVIATARGTTRLSRPRSSPGRRSSTSAVADGRAHDDYTSTASL
jgi:hypothetical protein